ncbi:biotin--[acetyl-CoA-carboxylase] ligase [Maribacter sp. 2307ULW6-5]|uniref:biotin--[acetyl-CoA-carboxylase] ligase n=1 Tax=Maribacter sp. 2307ULW6-5 TaxID=3386275 RepID=UPI0039BC59C1
MQLLKLDATPSTNTYLKERLGDADLRNGTVVWARKQTMGRGQMGNPWISEGNKNLTFSVLRRFKGFLAKDAFLLTQGTSLAVHHVLMDLKVPQVRIKWPNDIMSGNAKMCGILIENTLVGPQLVNAIIGVGLNVNQTAFPKGINATSIRARLGREMDVETLLYAILEQLDHFLEMALTLGWEGLYPQYGRALYKMGKESSFGVPGRGTFRGSIQGVARDGRLQVRTSAGQLRSFGLKELEFLD